MWGIILAVKERIVTSFASVFMLLFQVNVGKSKVVIIKRGEGKCCCLGTLKT